MMNMNHFKSCRVLVKLKGLVYPSKLLQFNDETWITFNQIFQKIHPQKTNKSIKNEIHVFLTELFWG